MVEPSTGAVPPPTDDEHPAPAVQHPRNLTAEDDTDSRAAGDSRGDVVRLDEMPVGHHVHCSACDTPADVEASEARPRRWVAVETDQRRALACSQACLRMVAVTAAVEAGVRGRPDDQPGAPFISSGQLATRPD